MEIIESNLVKIFRKDYEGKSYYRAGISKKDQNGNYINGYLDVRFGKDVVLENGTNIYIKKAWISFYLKDKKTIPYVFINEFETVTQTVERIKQEAREEKHDPYEEIGNQVRIDEFSILDDDLPF